jgi:hypothetical protein
VRPPRSDTDATAEGDDMPGAAKTAVQIFLLFVVAGLLMAGLVFGMSLVLPMDRVRLHIWMLLALLSWTAIGIFYSVRFFILASRGGRGRP